MEKVSRSLLFLLIGTFSPVILIDLLWHYRVISFEPNILVSGLSGFITSAFFIFRTWDKG